MAMGERSPIALLNPTASAKMAVGEALTNIAAAGITALDRVRLSANWMASADHPHEGAALYDAVHAIGLDMCPALGIAIPVGKDSMSMKTKWEADGKSNLVSSPVSLVITAYAPVDDARRVLTPELRTEISSTSLIFIDLAGGKKRLGGSCIAQVYGQLGHETPNVENYEWIKSFFKAIGKLSEPSSDRPFGSILAYHDRSDGGLIVTLLEMCFAGHAGCTLNLDTIAENSSNLIPALFNEELGAVIQVRDCDIDHVVSLFHTYDFPPKNLHILGCVTRSGTIELKQNDKLIFSDSRSKLHRRWSETSYKIQSIRDNSDCASEEFNSILDDSDPGLFVDLKFDFIPELSPIQLSTRPKVAILREQGINSYLEMAFAFDSVGFEVVDVHMTDIISGSISLSPFVGLACPGGFSYGDVLGAGVGWANSKNKIFLNMYRYFTKQNCPQRIPGIFQPKRNIHLGNL
jgi:phosphoribosylformylglycinamidine synthase